MKPSQLSELSIRKFETPGRVEVHVTHLPTGTFVQEIYEGNDRIEAKKRAYRRLAKLLTEQGL